MGDCDRRLSRLDSSKAPRDNTLTMFLCRAAEMDSGQSETQSTWVLDMTANLALAGHTSNYGDVSDILEQKPARTDLDLVQ